MSRIYQAQESLLQAEQTPIHTDHLIHAGMYIRTITMPPNTKLVGAMIKIPTCVITVGEGRVLVDKWQTVRGYQVLPGAAFRKQAFFSIGPLIITMFFPTAARTVEEAEKEFTDEHELLLSHRQDLNTVRITEV